VKIVSDNLTRALGADAVAGTRAALRSCAIMCRALLTG
jgi:hypothetical protein